MKKMANKSSLKKDNLTSIQRPNPFVSLQNELNKAVNDVYKMFESPSSLQHFENLDLNPSIDIVEDKDSIKIEAEMPGLDENNIKVSIENGMLTIRGEKTVSSKDEGKNYLMREIGYGSYLRSIPLPDSADIENAKASFKKGMLWVKVPRKQKLKRNRKS